MMLFVMWSLTLVTVVFWKYGNSLSFMPSLRILCCVSVNELWSDGCGASLWMLDVMSWSPNKYQVCSCKMEHLKNVSDVT